MLTILGAGGAIANDLASEVAARGERIRLVRRNPKPVSGAETFAADVANLDDAVKAVAGSRVVVLTVGLKYDLKVWRELWPRIMRNTIEACKRAGARLIFFDNVYAYGKVDGPMTEETPFRPLSKKGELRAEIATMLLDEIKAGTLTALIARAADFYGPDVRTGLPNVLIFDKLAKKQRAMWLSSVTKVHSFTFTPDAARSVALLADRDDVWNQTWHVPTAPNPPAVKELIELSARELDAPAKYFVLTPSLVWVTGLFDSNVRELYEMLYQYEYDYVFDSTKFNTTFGFQPTSYVEGVHRTAEFYKSRGGPPRSS